jgi:hypothetical protein
MFTRRWGVLGWEGASSQLRQLDVLAAKRAYTQVSKVGQKSIIGAALRRDLIEKSCQSREPQKHVIDGICGPGDRYYAMTLRLIREACEQRTGRGRANAKGH